jgi:nitrous oxide reductase accessory protein NosL
MRVCRGTVAVFVFVFVLLLTGAEAPKIAEAAPVAATKADKCPVCGMFVAKYPDFLAQILFADGSYALFDGAKDMYKYFFNIKKYNAAKDRSDIASIYVTDYYSMTLIDGKTAWYVVGSDVFGPMGRELIPFQNEAEAKEFMKDHAGKQLLRFDAVTPEIIKELE